MAINTGLAGFGNVGAALILSGQSGTATNEMPAIGGVGNVGMVEESSVAAMPSVPEWGGRPLFSTRREGYNFPITVYCG